MRRSRKRRVHFAMRMRRSGLLPRGFYRGFSPSLRAVGAIVGRCALCAADAAELLAQAINASGMGLACELWLGPAMWAYANAALEAARIEMRARGFSTEDAIESRE